MTAIKEIGDRLDGRPHQTQENKNTYDATDKFLEVIRRVNRNEGSGAGDSVVEIEEGAAILRDGDPAGNA
jgi:hypothetical protein